MDMYIGLFNDDKELKGEGYKRIKISDTLWILSMGNPASNSISVFKNANRIEFSIAKQDWGSITHFGFFGKLKGGKPRLFKRLDTSISSKKNSAIIFYPGGLRIIGIGE